MALAPVQLISDFMEDYPNYWLKFYEQGTTTPLAMAVDSTGSTTVAKAEISAGSTPPLGLIKTAGNVTFIPYLAEAYDAYIFPTEAEADANDTSNAIQLADNVDFLQNLPNSVAGVLVANMVANSDLNIGDFVDTVGYTTAGDGGDNSYEIVAAATGTVDGGSYIDLTGSGLQAKGLFPRSLVNTRQFSDDVNAAISYQSSSGGIVYVVGNISVAAAIDLLSNVVLEVPSGCSVTWGGAAGGTFLRGPQSTVLSNSGIICSGGYLDMVAADFGLVLHGTQLCQFDIEFRGTAVTSRVVWLKGDGTSTAGSTFGTTNISSNGFDRIVHTGDCGELLRCSGENNASLGGIITLNRFGQLRSNGAAIGGLFIDDWTDTNQFTDPINIRMNANNSSGVVIVGSVNNYELIFSEISLGPYGTFTGRQGIQIGSGPRHIFIDNLFVDGDLDTEAGNININSGAQSYWFRLHTVTVEGARIKEYSRRYERASSSYNGDQALVTMATDTATSFDLTRDYGVVTFSATSGNAAGQVWVKVASTGASVKKLAGDATFFEVTTGILAGTTGSASRFTVSPNNDGKVYIENRLGIDVDVTWTVMSAFTP